MTLHGRRSPTSRFACSARCAKGGLQAPRILYRRKSTPSFLASVSFTSISVRTPKPSALRASTILPPPRRMVRRNARACRKCSWSSPLVGETRPLAFFGFYFGNFLRYIVHVEVADMLDQLVERPSGKNAGLAVEKDAITKGHQGGDGADVERRSQRRLGVGVDLGEHHVSVLAPSRFVDWRKGATWPTPGS